MTAPIRPDSSDRARVQRNIARVRRAGGSDADVARYLREYEGAPTDDPLHRRVAALRRAGATEQEVNDILDEEERRPAAGDDDQARIRRNVQRMASQGASEREIESYLRDYEGLRPGAAPPLPGFASESTAMTGLSRQQAAERDAARGYSPAAQTARAVGQGAAFGFGDEAEAGIGAMVRHPMAALRYLSSRGMDPAAAATLGGEYEGRAADLRAREAAFRRDYPVLATGAEAVGSVGSGLLMGGAAVAKAGGSLGRRALASAGAGALGGAVAGAGTANGDLGDRATGALRGGAIGGALGGALPVAVQGARGAYRMLRAPAGDRAARLAQQKIAEAIGRDRTTLDDLVGRVDELSDAPITRPVTLMDAGDDSIRGLARAAQTTPGEGRKIIGQFLDERDAGQGARLQGAFSARADVRRENLVKLAKQLQETRTADAERLYGEAFRKAAAEIDDAELFDLLQNYPSFRESWPKAVKIAQEREGLRAVAARTRGVGELPGETAEQTVAKKNARGLYTDARAPGGGFRRPDTVSDEGILAELRSLYERSAEAGGTRGQYARVFDDDESVMRTVATGKGKVSTQAKARQNIEDWDRIIANYEAELKKRGHTETSIADALWGQAGDEAALERAAMQHEGGAADDWFFDPANPNAPIPDVPGSAAPRRKPTPRELHNLKLAMDERIEGAAGANPLTNTGAGNTMAGLMSANQRKLVEKLDEHIPGYDVARRTFAEGSDAMRAVESGQRAWTKAPEQIADEMAELGTDEARDLYRRAFANRILREMRKVKGGRDVGAAVFGSRGRVAGAQDILERARMAFPDEQQWRLFVRDLEAEAALSEASRDVGVGSRTAPALAEQADLQSSPAVQAALQLGSGRPVRAGMTALFAGAKRRAQGFSEDVGREVAKRLTANRATDPETFAAYLYALRRATEQNARALHGERTAAGVIGAQVGLRQR